MPSRVIPGALALVGFPALLQLVLHPLLSGGSVWTWAAFWLYTTFGVIVPGTLVALRTLSWRADWLSWLGIGWTLGHCFELAGLLIGRALGDARIGLAWILVAYLLALWPGLRTRLAPSRPGAVPNPIACALALVLLMSFSGGVYFALNVPEISTAPPFVSDPWFHVGNAHEFRDHSPMQDPRIAGDAFNYHVFGYAASAAASLATGQAVAPLLLRYSGMAWVFLLVLNLFNVGRTLRGGGIVAGALGAAFVVFAIDPGLLFAPRLAIGSQMALYGIYLSTTTLAGQVFLSALLLVLLEHARATHWRNAWAIALLAFAGAGSKAMFGPVVLCGAAGLAGWKTLVRRRLDARSLGTAAILLLGIAPPTLMLLLGEGSYVESIQWVFGAFPRATPFFRTLVAWGFPEWLPIVLWLPVFAAPLLFGAIVASLRIRRGSDRAREDVPIEPDAEADYAVFVWMFLIAALVPTLGIRLRGWSELFFLYFALTPLATLAGVGWVGFARSRIARPVLVGCVALWVVVQLATGFAGRLALFDEHVNSIWSRTSWWTHAVTHRDERLVEPREQPSTLPAYQRKISLTPEIAAGLEWARRHLPADAVFAVNVQSASVYGALSESRAFLDATDFSAKAHVARSQGRARGLFAARRALLDAWVRGRPGFVADLRSAGVTHLFVDRVNGRSVAVDHPDLGAPVFENRDFAIFEIGPAR